MIAPAEAELCRSESVDLLEARAASFRSAPAVTTYSTPRRIAVLVEKGVAAKQEDVTEELVGHFGEDRVQGQRCRLRRLRRLQRSQAFRTKAQWKTISTPKGEYIAVTVKRAGRSAAEVLTDALPKEIAGIYWAKNMYWRAGKPERFRCVPLRWMALALLDSARGSGRVRRADRR